MVNLVDLVNPGYQKAVDAAGKNYKTAETQEAAEEETAGKTQEAETAAKQPNEDVYEPEDKEEAAKKKAEDDAAASYKPNQKLVEQLKAEQAQIQSRFVNMVKDMLGKQGKEISGDGIWKTLASGDFEVDAETQKAAQEAIAEDGYWGVKQTSERIVGFAKALVGGNPEKIELMKDAFEKGYNAAQKTWGGALPEIAQKTRSAVMDLFDEWEKEGKSDGGDEAEDAEKTESSKE